MAYEHIYSPGDWLVICDVCSKKIKASQAQHRWDGLIVCPEDYETRHIQDFIRTPTEVARPDFIRAPVDEYLNNACSIPGRSGYAGIAVAGCAIAGNTMFSVEELLAGYICLIESHRSVADFAGADCAQVGTP